MICGKCKAPAESAATVQACYAGERVPCGWLVEYPGTYVEVEMDGEHFSDWIEGGVKECGAHVTFTDRGWSCEAGHEHVSMEARHAEGWEYAECYDEAQALAAAGVEPVHISTAMPVRDRQDFA